MSSSNRLRVLIVGSHAEGDALGEGLRGHAEIVGIERQTSLALSAARTHRPDLCLVFMDQDPAAALELTRQLNTEAVSVPIVVSSNKQSDNILHAMRAGARDFAHFDGSQNGQGGAAADALRAIREYQHAQVSARPARACKVITVFGCKGGAGATTVATNLAHAIRVSSADASDRPEVVIVDFDTMLGDVMVMLDVKHPFGFRDLLDNMPRLDAELLRTSLARHESGFHVLAGAGQADPMAEFAPADLDRILAFLALHFDYIVIDGVRDFHEHALVALDRADAVLCVMTQDLPSLKNANRALKLFDTLGYPAGKLQLLVNRYSSARKLTLETIGDALSHAIDATVQNDFPIVSRCVDAGVLITEKEPGSKVGKDLRSVAGLYHQAAPEKRRGLFSLWSKS